MEYSKEDLMEVKKQILGWGENMGTESCKQKSIAEIKKSRKICAAEKGHDKTGWRKSFASRDKVAI